MSRFLKNFFGEKSKSENLNRNASGPGGATLSRERSNLQINNFVVDGGSLTEESDGIKLGNLWKQYTAPCPEDGDETEQLEIKYKTLYDIAQVLRKFYANRDPPDGGMMVIANTTGHPLQLISAFCVQMCAILKNESDLKSAEPTELFRSDLVQVDHLYISPVSQQRRNDQSPSVSIEDSEEKRTKLLIIFEVLAIIVNWPQNVANMRSNFGKSLYSYLLTCYGRFASKLVELSSKTFIDNLDPLPFLNQRQLEIEFTMTVLLLLTRIFSNSLLWTSHEFFDFLPMQPWTAVETTAILKEQRTLSSQSNDIENNNSFNSFTLPNPIKNGFLRAKQSALFPSVSSTNAHFDQLRKDNASDWVSSSCLTGLSGVWKVLQQVRLIAKYGEIFPTLVEQERQQEILSLIIEAEILHTISNVFAVSTESIRVCFDEDFSISDLLKSVLEDRFTGMVGESGEMVDALVTRMQLLCIRINCALMDHQTSDSVFTSYNGILPPSLVARVFVWYQSKYQHMDQQLNWMHNSINTHPIQFQFSKSVGQVCAQHDLWPWKFDTVMSSIPELTSFGGNFHILKNELIATLSFTIKKQAAYILWDTVICELLGSQALSTTRPPVNQGSKVHRPILRYIFQVFRETFQDKIFQESSITNEECLCVPLGQIKFIDFLSQLFKAAEADDIYAALEEFDVLQLLLGDRFLCSYSLPLSFFSNVFDDIKSNEVPTGQIDVAIQAVKPQYSGIIGWLLLQNGVLDFFHGLVFYSIFFQSSKSDVVSYLGHEDLMLLLTKKMITQARSYRSMHIVYQLAKLLINLNDTISNQMAMSSLRKESRDKIVTNLFEIVETISRSRNANAIHSQQAGTVDQDASIVLAASNASAESLIHIITINAGPAREWLDIFLLDENYRSVDLSSEFQRIGIHRRRSMSGSKVSGRYSIDKSPAGEQTKTPAEDNRDGKGGKLRGTVASLLTILVDENLYLASLQISKAILIACAEETLVIDKLDSSNESSRKRKQSLRTLAAEVIGSVLVFIAVSHKHTNIKSGMVVALASLNSLINLMRDEIYSGLRLTFQEFIRRENLLYEILRAFARCLNGFDVIKQKCDKTMFVEVEKESSKIMRSCLSLITATVCGNDACKNVLSLLLQANREKVGSSRVKTSSDNRSKEAAKGSIATKNASGLSSLILCGERSPLKETIIVMLDLLLDGPHAGLCYLSDGLDNGKSMFSNDDDRPKIKNLAILPDYFHLIPHCEESVQLFALESFKNLISGRASLINLNVCSTSRPKVLDIALDLFPYLPDKVQSSNAELVELLGRHSVSVASLKHLFRALQQTEGLKHPYSWKIIQALQGMFLHDSGPKHTFVFDGSGSGLKLPTIHKWPQMKGFAFCCWIRIESPKQRSGHIEINDGGDQVPITTTTIEELYNPFILSLRDNLGTGLELYLKRSTEAGLFRIILRNYSENGDTSTFYPDAEDFKVVEDKWFFLGISITQNSFYNKGEALIVLNSKSARQEFSFTKLPDNMNPLIGECSPDFQLNLHQHTLRGQMGAMYFFSESINETQLRSICSLGPDYVYNFEPSSADYKDLAATGSQKGGTKLAILEDGILTSKILLTYNPVVLRGKYFLDNTPEKNDVKWRVPSGVELVDEIRADSSKHCKMHAMRLAGTYRSTIQDARLALNSLGGIKAIIPLFAQIDQGLGSAAPTSSANTTAAVVPPATFGESHETNFFPAVLGLFTTLIEDSSENRKNFHRCGGFNTIRYLLDRADPMNFNLITFNQFVALYLKLEKDLVLQDAILDNVLCNFKLWAYSLPEVQYFLMDWLIFTFRTDKNIYPQALSVQRLIDTFYQYYDYEVARIPSFLQNSTSTDSQNNSEQNGVVAALSISNPAIMNANNITGRVRLSNIGSEAIESVRLKMFGLMKVSLRQRVLPDDVASIIKYLSMASTDRARKEVLLFLIDIVMERELRDRWLQILLGFLWGNSIRLLEYVLLVGSEDVQLLVLHLYALVLHQMKTQWAALASLYIQFASETPSTGVPATPASNPSASGRVHSNSADGDLLTELKKQKLNRTLETESVTSPSNFMHGSGLMQNSCKLLHTAINIFLTPASADSTAPSNMDAKSIFNLFRDMMFGSYPDHFVTMVRARLNITETRLPSPSRHHRTNHFASPVFAFPFVYFLILRGCCLESMPEHVRLDELESLLKLLTPFTAEQLLGVVGWQDIVAACLNSVYKMKGACAPSSTSLCLQILSKLVLYSMRLGKTSDYNFVVSPDMELIPVDVQYEVYSRITRGERYVGMTSIRDLVHALEASVESYSFKSFLIYHVLFTSINATKTLLREFQSCPTTAYDSAEFYFVQRRTVWLIGLIMIEYFEMMRADKFDCSVSKPCTSQLQHWIEIHQFFESVETSACRLQLIGQLVKGYLEFATDFKSDLHIPIFECSQSHLFVEYEPFVGKLERGGRFVIGSIPWIALHLAYKFIALCIKSQFEMHQVTPLLLVLADMIDTYEAVNGTLGQFEKMYFCIYLAFASTISPSLQDSSAWNTLRTKVEMWLKVLKYEFSMLAKSTVDHFATRQKEDHNHDDEDDDDRLEVIAKILEQNITTAQCRNYSRHGHSDGYDAASKMFGSMFTADLAANIVNRFNIDKILDVSSMTTGSSKSIASACANVWRELSQFMMDFIEFTEEELIPVRMMEYGLGDFVFSNERDFFAASGTTGTTVVAAISSKGAANVVNGPCQELVAFTAESESVRMCDYWKQIDTNNRRSELKWSRIFSQLANERGPWGYGADSRREVFWMLDSLETDRHVKLRMKRNPMGTRHMIASLKAAGIDSADEQAAALSTIEDTSLSGIYADLKKYKKRMIMEQASGGEDALPTTEELPATAGTSEKDDGGEKVSDGEEETPEENNNTDAVADSEVVIFNVEVITPASNPSGGKTQGRVEISRHKISFIRAQENRDYDFVNKTGNAEFMWACECFPSMTWVQQEITGVYRRHYQMRYVALEIFFVNRTSVFFNCLEKSAAVKAYRFLLHKCKSPNMHNLFIGRPQDAMAKVVAPNGLSLTQAWVLRKISNFDYLMYLNMIAGRSFNDLAQYPVFPWVIADYKSSKIDLKDPRIYRKFDRPMAAQLDSQQEFLREKYESCEQLQDDGIFPYHTGSHYSTAAMVIWYLLRMEPFTSYHVWLQDGKFDRPDRLFHSIDHTYTGCTTNTQDVKELVPEFFYNPEFLYNTNHCEFGKRQTGQYIDDVALPRWCRDATEFIRINRDALESEYVSSQLHNWIDLVFGSRQRPPFLPGGSDRAVESLNVFVHLSYVDAVDLESMKTSDPMLYNRTIRQIDCYGQTPCQLFTKDHPKRKSLEEIQDLIWPIASIVLGADTLPKTNDGTNREVNLEKPTKVLCYGEFKVSNNPILFIAEFPGLEKLVTIDSSRVLGYHTFTPRQPDNVPPFTMKPDKVALQQSSGQNSRSSSISISSYLPNRISKEKTVGIPFAAAVVLSGSIIDRPNDLDLESIGTKENRLKYLREENRNRGRPPEAAGGVPASPSTVSQRYKETPVRGLTKAVSSSSLMDESHQSMSFANIDALKQSLSERPMSARDAMEMSQSPDASTRLMMIQRGDGNGDKGISDTASVAGSTASTAASTASGSSATGNKPVLKRDRADEHLSPHLFCVIPVFKLLVSCGHWDNTFKITASDTGKLVQSLSYHREVVTCVATTSDYGKHWIVAGSKDCTLTIWEIFPERESEPVNASPCHTLYGHDDAINCVAVHNELDLVVSGSDDGTIIIHTLRDGLYIRSINFGVPVFQTPTLPTARQLNLPTDENPTLSSNPNGAVSATGGASASGSSSSIGGQSLEKTRRVHAVVISKEGYIVGYSNDGYVMTSYTLNGRYLRLAYVREKLYALCLSDDGRVVLTGGERGLIVLRWVHNLTIADTGPRRGLEAVLDGSNEGEFAPFPSPIRSMCMTTDERHLIVGLETGEIRILAQDSEYLRRKLHRRLMEIGILSM